MNFLQKNFFARFLIKVMCQYKYYFATFDPSGILTAEILISPDADETFSVASSGE